MSDSSSSRSTRTGGNYLNDEKRLEALRASRLLDSPPEEAFDRLTRLASRLLNAPVALVSLVDDRRQYFKSLVGLPAPVERERQTPLSHSFCQYVVNEREMLVVEDAREHPILRGNGAIEDLNVVAYAGAPLTDRSGHTLGSFCVIHPTPHQWSDEELEILADLAESVSAAMELRRLARDLRMREATLRSLFDSTATLIWLIDEKGKIMRANAKAAELAGVEPDKAEGIEFVSAPWWPRSRTHSRRLQGALDSARTGRRTSFEAAMASKRGQLMVEFSVGPVPGDDGEVELLVAEAVDISHRKRVERLRGNVVALLMQELRGPLGVSRGALQLLGRDRGKFEPNELRMLDLVTSNVDHVVHLLQDVLELTLLEDQGLHPTLKPARLLLESAAEQVRPQANSLAVSLELAASSEQLETDAALASRALALMLSHALRRAPAGSVVTASVRADADLITFAISDQGAPVPSERLARYFDASASGSGEGGAERRTGERSRIGLTIAQSIAELLAGSVGVGENELGRFEMVLSLPRADGREGAAEVPAGESR